MGDCPVCARQFASLAALQTHVDAHFLDEDQQAAVPGTSAAPAPAATTACPQCGARLAAADQASHALAHQLEQEELQLASAGNQAAVRTAAEELDARAAAELAAQEWGGGGGSGGGGEGSDDDAHHLQQLEALYFEQLRAKYGFTTQPRPGCCNLCGQAGHWVRDCPRNPDNQEAQRRVLPDPQPHLVCSTQQRASFTALPSSGGAASSSGGGSGGGSLVPLLAACLEQQTVPKAAEYQAAVCGEVQHFGATLFSSGWGCGYNNMQVLAWHLLAARPEAQEVLFGGAGWVPDIPALQAWLEAAWGAGFDRQGAEQLEGRVQGTQKWVGTTECATLLRYFGLRAQIIDFGTQAGQAPAAPAAAAAAGSAGSSGAPVPVHPNVECDGCGQCPIRGDRYQSQVLPNYDLCGTCHASSANAAAVAAAGPFCRMMPGAVAMGPSRQGGPAAAAAAAGVGGGASGGASGECSMQEQLLLWVWRYFMGADDAANGTQPSSTAAGGSMADGAQAAAAAGARAAAAAAGNGGKRQRLAPPPRVRLSGRAPLYFQHEGHSRTIIGIERRLVGKERRAEHTLLVLDPGTPGAKLAAALQQRQGWQRLLKRGPHTLRHQQYQLLYVERGIAAGSELEELKLVASRERY